MRPKYLLLLALGLAAAPLIAFSQGRLPPIGSRAYVIDAANPYAPVTIESSQAAAHAKPSKLVLKDPVQPSHVVAPEPAHVAKRPAATAVLAKAGQLHFKKLAIPGHLTRPRVEFTHDSLQVDRADEPVGQDFFPKVYAPVKDDSF